MRIRKENPALWRGTSKVEIYDNDVLVNYKHDNDSNNSVIYICNLGYDPKTVKFAIPQHVNSMYTLIGECNCKKAEKPKGEEERKEEFEIYEFSIDSLSCAYIKVE